jgi:penicillin amidase
MITRSVLRRPGRLLVVAAIACALTILALAVRPLAAALVVAAGIAATMVVPALRRRVVAAGVLLATRPRHRSGSLRLDDLTSDVSVTFDDRGVPVIEASSRRDAIIALGYVTARDRFFQMDFLRRQASGRLSEIFGYAMLPRDIEQRRLGFHRVGPAILAKLPDGQRAMLEAFAAGVNAYLRFVAERPRARTPPELTLLGYRAEPWSPLDSILVAQNMFSWLSGDLSEARSLAVMRGCLEEEVVRFFTPAVDPWDSPIVGDASTPKGHAVPIAALERAFRRIARPIADTTPRLPRSLGGASNAWAVSASISATGRAILANDTHLWLGVPNIWYRAEMTDGERSTAGVMLAGVPAFIAGSTRDIAWGVTRLCTPCMELIAVDERSCAIEEVTEIFTLPDGKRVETIVRVTEFGPLAGEPLLGKPVAIRWTALDANGVDLALTDLEDARTVDEALDVFARFGGPPVGAVVADRNGRIGFVAGGRLPGLPADQRPRLVDPPGGIIVAANQRPSDLGGNHQCGHRARRIAALLGSATALDEQTMAAIQADTRAEVLDFYRDLIVDLAHEPGATLVRSWDGHARADSTAFSIIVLFRQGLLESVFAPFLAVCQERDPAFRYPWAIVEPPLRALLSERPASLNPYPDTHASWTDFLRAELDRAVVRAAALAGRPVADAQWGEINRAQVHHPLVLFWPEIAGLFSMPDSVLSGWLECVAVANQAFGATMRMVISPGELSRALFSMPGGQSGHPLSQNYDDQQDAWARLEPRSFRSSGPTTSLRLLSSDRDSGGMAAAAAPSRPQGTSAPQSTRDPQER